MSGPSTPATSLFRQEEKEAMYRPLHKYKIKINKKGKYYITRRRDVLFPLFTETYKGRIEARKEIRSLFTGEGDKHTIGQTICTYYFDTVDEAIKIVYEYRAVDSEQIYKPISTRTLNKLKQVNKEINNNNNVDNTE